MQILRLIDKNLIDLKPHQGDGLPRLEVGDESRLHLRVAFKEIVKPVGESVAKLARTRVRVFILRHRKSRYFKGAIQQVRCLGFFAVHLRSTPDCLYVVVFNLPEVIFGLCISVSKDATRIGWTIDVRHTVAVAIDRDRMRKPLDTSVGCLYFGNQHAHQHERGDTYCLKQ